MKKRLVQLNFNGSDGSDPARMTKLFLVVDDEGMTCAVEIPADAADEDAALRDAVTALPPVEYVSAE